MKEFATLLIFGLLFTFCQGMFPFGGFGSGGMVSQMSSMGGVGGSTFSTIGGSTFGGTFGGGGSGRQVSSGMGPDGRPYYRDSDMITLDDIIYKTVRTYDAEARRLIIKVYTQDLKDPNADFVVYKLC